jgi:hypothetical protein
VTPYQIAALIFAAGVFYAGVRSLRSDVNGLGRKVRGEQAKRIAIIKAMILSAPDAETRKRATDLLDGV